MVAAAKVAEAAVEVMAAAAVDTAAAVMAAGIIVEELFHFEIDHAVCY